MSVVIVDYIAGHAVTRRGESVAPEGVLVRDELLRGPEVIIVTRKFIEVYASIFAAMDHQQPCVTPTDSNRPSKADTELDAYIQEQSPVLARWLNDDD